MSDDDEAGGAARGYDRTRYTMSFQEMLEKGYLSLDDVAPPHPHMASLVAAVMEVGRRSFTIENFADPPPASPGTELCIIDEIERSTRYERTPLPPFASAIGCASFLRLGAIHFHPLPADLLPPGNILMISPGAPPGHAPRPLFPPGTLLQRGPQARLPRRRGAGGRRHRAKLRKARS